MLMDTVGSEMLLLFGKLGLRLGPFLPLLSILARLVLSRGFP